MAAAADQTAIRKMKRVRGGSINESFFVETEKNKYFIKCHPNPPKHFFSLEAKGLWYIKETETISVPNVLAYSDEKEAAFLVLEWIEGQETKNTQATLGHQLAAMHEHAGMKHGFPKDTYIGILPQPNGIYDSWLEYYRDRRLRTQLELGIEHNMITGKRREQMERLLQRLGDWIPGDAKPSYLHGDLWGGNWMSGPGGRPYLIDPSFLFGDRHFEIAFTELFGGFSQAFYRAYSDRFSLDSHYEEKKPLYQLYYLLVHLNIFGELYGTQVDAVLKRYVG
ncbi:fructosamine kinase family protein [Siminovitchia sp. 179-K 8D1 HS]